MPSVRGPERTLLASNEHLLIGVGERFANIDRSSRQNELARCYPGEPVHLNREFDNPHDAMAVAIYSCRGVQVGYLSREHAKWVAPLIDDAQPACVTVAAVAPKGRPFSPLALTIKLRVNAE